MPVEGTFLTHVRETVTILRPMKSVFVRGVASTEKQSPTFSMRLSERVLREVDEAAAALDMTRSSFIRWCASAVATDILKQKAEYDAEHPTKR